MRHATNCFRYFLAQCPATGLFLGGILVLNNVGEYGITHILV